MFPAKSLKSTFYFSSVEYKTEIKSSNENIKQKLKLEETFCPQQHLFTQNFSCGRRGKIKGLFGMRKQMKLFAPKYFFVYFYSVFSRLDGYFPGFLHCKPVPNIAESISTEGMNRDFEERHVLQEGRYLGRSSLCSAPRFSGNTWSAGKVTSLQRSAADIHCDDSQAQTLPCTHTRSAASQVLRC